MIAATRQANPIRAAILIAAALAATGCTSGGRHSTPSASSSNSGSGGCQRAADTAAGPSRPVQVSHDSYWGHAEPDIAADPRTTSDLRAASQVELGPHTRVPASYTSTDGGRYWHKTRLLPLPKGYAQGADTTVAFGPDGTGYVAATAVPAAGNGFASRVHRGAVVVWRTPDAAAAVSPPPSSSTWAPPSKTTHGWPSTRPLAARPASSTSPGPTTPA